MHPKTTLLTSSPHAPTKPDHHIPLRIPTLLAVICLPTLHQAHADDGLWDADADGNWSDLANWSGGAGPIADGPDFTATFDGISASRTVTLDTARTIGNISFDDGSDHLEIAGVNILTLDTTSGTPTIDVADEELTITSVIDGNDGLEKAGAGILRLDAANIFTGGIDFSAGQIIIRSSYDPASFGDSSNVLTFSADARIHNAAGAFTMDQGITINDGVTGEITGAFGEKTYVNGPLAGSGTLYVQGNSAGFVAEFRNTGNTFTGPIEVQSGDSVVLGMASLADSPAATTIGLDSQSNNGAKFVYLSGAIAPLVLNNRQIELIVNGNAGTNLGRQPGIVNNAGDELNTITINTDLLITGTGSKKFYLSGGNAGDNTFAGVIPDAIDTGVLTLYKDGGGKWILTGVNTYEGGTNIVNGTLEIGGAGQLGGGSYAGNISIGTGDQLTYNSTAAQTFSGVISGPGSLVMDNASSTLSLTNANTYAGDTTVTAGTLSLGDGTNNSNLSGFSTLSVESGGVLDLNYVGSDTVLVLNIGGSPVAVGTWGATGSGATNIDDTHFTGTGVINNLGGVLVNNAFWDAGTTDIGTDGNSSGSFGDGIWDTTTMNWDIGFTPHAAWGNTTSDKAYFDRGNDNGNRTVTLGSDITLAEIDYRGTRTTNKQFYIGDASEDNTLNFGGAARITTENYYVTIRAGITGSPTFDYTSRSGDNNSLLALTPAGSLTMTTGLLDIKKNPASNKNAILQLGGDSTGNSVSQINWSNGAHQLQIQKIGAGTWTVGGGWENGPNGDARLRVIGGTLILDGTWETSHEIDVESGGTLKGDATLGVARTGTDEHVRVLDGGTLAPGTSVGTINVNDKTTIAGTLEIEIDGASADLLAITGDLDLGTATDVIKVVELGAATLANYTVVTYTGSLTGTFDTLDLPAGYSVDYSTAGEINLVIGGGTPYQNWATGGEVFGDDSNGDGIGNGVAFLLGATGPDANAVGLLPTSSEDGSGGLVMTFSMLKAANRGAAALRLEHSGDLGVTDAWTPVVVPDTTSTVGGVGFVVTPNGSLNDVVATLPSGEAMDGKLFGRVTGTEN